MIKFLTENDSYKVYALEESVYLKLKGQSNNYTDYQHQDLFVGCHYSNPTAALILGNYIITAGCGIVVFDLESQKKEAFFNEQNTITWTNGLHQDEMDAPSEFRYVALTKDDKLRVFKMNVLTKEVTQMH